MKKVMTTLLITLSALAVLLAAALVFLTLMRANTEARAAELIERHAAAGRTSFTLFCSDELYASLTANGGARIEALEIKGGIESAQVSFSPIGGQLRFTGVRYVPVPWAEVEDESGAQAAIERFTADRAASFALICPPSLSDRLRNEARISAYLAMGGVFRTYTLAAGERSGVLKLSGLTYTDEAYAPVSNAEQFAEAVDRFAAEGLDAFSIAFHPDYYADCRDNDASLILAEGLSKLLLFDRSAYDQNCVMRYSDVTYSYDARAACFTEEDIVEAIAAMGSAGEEAFTLVLPDAALYDSLSQDDFRRLQPLQTRGGLVTCRMYYDRSGGRLFFTDALIVPDAVQLGTLAEAIDYVDARADAGEEDIYLFCSPELYADLVGDRAPEDATGMERIYDLVSQAGIFNYEMSGIPDAGILLIHVTQLYLGRAISRAVQSSDFSALSARQAETMSAAVAMAHAAAADTPLETARNIHDALCERIIYVDDDATDEDDNAVGAILDGRANCDGYADAFYLIGTLAGLNVRYQHGDSYDADTDANADIPQTHLWNLLEIDGTWRQVDVTFDDEEDGWSYTWFDLGYDRASRTHIWNEDMSVSLRETTDLSERPENEFSIRQAGDVRSAVNTAAQLHLSEFRLIFDNASLAAYDDALDLISDTCGRDFFYSVNEHMRMLTAYGVF